MHCKMFSTISLVNIHQLTELQIFLLVMRIFKTTLRFDNLLERLPELSEIC